MPASKYIEPDGQFKPVDGSRFKGCVAAQMAKGLNEKDAQELCAYIGRKAGKIKGSALETDETVSPLDADRTSDGHGYRQNKDGTFTIYDVPVMATLAELEKQNKKPIGRPWLMAAVHKAEERFAQDGYLAPLHVDHHGEGRTEPAGFVFPRSVKEFSYEGKKTWAIFADLQVTPDILERIKANTLPYRSVEIHNWDEPEISSLAMLQDSVPYFRFGVLKLGERLGQEQGDTQTFSQPGPAMAARAYALGSAVLFSFQGDKMTNTEPGALSDAPEITEQTAEAVTSDSASLAEDVDVSRAIREIHDRMDETHDIVKRIAAKMGLDEDDEEAEEVKDTETSEVVEAPVEQSAGGSSLASLQGKIAALENRERIRKDESERSAVVESAMVALSAWGPDAAIRDNIIALVATSKEPGRTAETFVRSYKSSVPQRPSATLEDFDARMGAAADPSEVLKFAHKGPDALTMARQASAQFDELSLAGEMSSTREEFITTQISHANGESF